jgi:hypothetical protein
MLCQAHFHLKGGQPTFAAAASFRAVRLEADIHNTSNAGLALHRRKAASSPFY